ncbi:Uncharacterised protein [Mycobacteroides abscessus subsp. abscessus]|nr:Uncharacterised protein [Mycobacteroides abscessus subsp. abscessus]
MPGSPFAKNMSPMIAPTTTSPDAVRNPVIIAGSAAGNSSFTNRWVREAFDSVNSSCMPRSTEVSPKWVLAMIGKIAMMTHTMVRATMPYPNHRPISGTIASTGMTCSTTAHG